MATTRKQKRAAQPTTKRGSYDAGGWSSGTVLCTTCRKPLRADAAMRTAEGLLYHEHCKRPKAAAPLSAAPPKREAPKVKPRGKSGIKPAPRRKPVKRVRKPLF